MDKPPDRPHEPVLLAIDDVARILGVSTSTVKRLVALRHLPAPKRVAGKLARWFSEDIDLYLYRLRRGDLD